jgi:hypothetical protein
MLIALIKALLTVCITLFVETVAWSGANVDVTDGYINTSELSTATITGKITNLSNALTCMTYLVLLFSPEVQSLSFANVQLPALSMLIALINCQFKHNRCLVWC